MTLPTGTVTFLFTDLEGSTRLWEEHPDAMQGALARHDEILRTAIDAHAGHVVKQTGDGVHAAFADSTSAVRAASAAQVALAREPWGPTGPLRVRMGIHTGPAEARDGDYYGTAVNKAARLMSVARGGQVVVSLATEEHLRDAGDDDLSLTDLGEHRLRDLQRAERVFQLCGTGLSADFPPLRTLDAFAGNLPTQLTSFLGREDELDRVAGMLRDARLVTLTGVGGVGKTRLAVQTAAHLLPQFPDGAWLCELAAASDPDALVQVIAATLAIQPRAGKSLDASIVDYLRTKRLLIVLDNCEHLLDAAARFADDVLRSCPDVRLLATSREGLAVDGEQIRPLRSLSLSNAELLFAERARAVAPDFAESDTPAIAEVCTRLDGIPLAIELAAARVSAMSPEEIAGLLDERFRLLTGGKRTAVERHQTLRAMVDWSYSLLEPIERLVFDRLAVFSGSFDAGAAAAVVAGDGVEPWDVRDALTSLVARSMIVAERADEGSTRYSMLETLRQYAREQLEERSDADAWRRRHAEHFVSFAEEAGAALLGTDEIAARRRVQNELGNLRVAVMWALDRDDPADVELGIGIVAPLWIEASASLANGIGAWAELCLDHAASVTREQLLNLEAAAAFYRMVGLADPRGATTLARGALAREVPTDSAGAATLFSTLAMALSVSDDRDAVFAVVREGEHVFDTDQALPYARASLLSANASIIGTSGRYEEAQPRAERGLAMARQLGNPSVLALALFAVAWSTWETDPVGALHAAEESIGLSRAGASHGALGSSLALAAGLRDQLGQPSAALAELRESIEYSRNAGDLSNLSYALHHAVKIFAKRERATVAAEVAGALDVGVMKAMSYVFGPDETNRRADARARARAVLGDREFDAATARGAAMTYNDVALLAIATIDELLEDTDDG